MKPLPAPHQPPGAPPTVVPAPRAPLPDDTVRTIVSEVARETVAECTGQSHPGHGVEYVDLISSAECAAALECLPLSDLLGLAPGLAGHLHRAATGIAGPSDRPTGLPVVLRLVAALIASRVAHDMLDVRLTQALHDAAHLEVARDSHREIGIAIGVLMTTRHCTEEAAFELMRTASQNQNRKLHDIAVEVRFTGTILPPVHAGRRDGVTDGVR